MADEVVGSFTYPKMNNNQIAESSWAPIQRWIVIGVLGYVAVTTTQSKEGVQDLKRDTNELKTQAVERDKKIQEIQDGMKQFATKAEMNAAEERLQTAFREQIRKATSTISGNDRGQNYER